MDWKRRSDQPRSRYEPDEGQNFEDEEYIDASSYEQQGVARGNPSAHTGYDHATVVDPVFAERGRIRRERQSSSFSTQRLNPVMARSNNRSSLLLLVGTVALIVLLLIGLIWFLSRGGGDGTATGDPSPQPEVAVTPEAETTPEATPEIEPSPIPEPSPTLAPSPSVSPNAFVVSGTGTAGLFLRQQPSTDAEIITTLPEGTPVEATGDTSNDGTREWRRVRTPQGEGWVAAEYLQPAQ